ncbi:hypothetical protein [Flavobacterium flavipallidum]|uniref:YD repeat-containing protein n=1 Tax=Flavobacterium flavipallidum TaxID=3139140 RepID=A0ABU9HJ72_9FLAO
MIETNENGVSENSVFKYIENQILNAENSKQKIDYTYNDGLITKIVIYNKEKETTTVLHYKYDNEKLVQVTSSEDYEINYTHNTDGTVTFEKYKDVAEGEGIKVYHGVLYFKNANLIKKECFYDVVDEDKVITSKVTFDYDTYNNPYFSILGYEKLLDKGALISKNNVVMTVAETTVFEGSQTISAAKMYTSTYKYDTDNYPVEQESEASLNNPNYSKIQYLY